MAHTHHYILAEVWAAVVVTWAVVGLGLIIKAIN